MVNFNVVDRFSPIVKDALTRVIREIVRRSITAMEKEAAQPLTLSVGQTQKGEGDFSPEVQEMDLPDAPFTAIEFADSPRRSIDTTERELRVFGIVKSYFERSRFAISQLYDSVIRKDVPVVLSYKDTTGYFGIFFNKPSYWVMRVSIEGRKNWVGFNVDEAIGSPLIPQGMVRLEPYPYATFRIQIASPDDIDKLHELVFAAFENTIREHARTKEAGEQEEVRN